MATTQNYITQDSADARYQALGSLGSTTPAAETAGAAGTAGAATSASRSDHVHPASTAAAVSVGTANAAGSAATFAASDHVHTGAALGRVSGGYAVATTNQVSITTAVDMASLTVTFTAVAGRVYRVTGSTYPSSTVTTDRVTMTINEGATQLQEASCVPASSAISLERAAVLTGVSAGAHTYKLTMARSVGTGTVTNNASTTFPSFILVEDIGT